MDKHLILTIISDDKPGIIKQIAQIVTKHNGNWLESQLSQLAGKFAGVIRISLPSTDFDQLNLALSHLKKNNIHIQLEELTANIAQKQKRGAKFNATGPDRQGIVLEITQALTEYAINVENLATRCSSMAYSGEPLFEVEGTLNIPDATDLEQLALQLETIADHLGIDITLEESGLITGGTQ